MKKVILFCLMLLVSVGTFAAAGAAFEVPVDFSNAGSVVAYLTTFIVLAATFVVKHLKPSIPGWATMMVVTGLSAVVTLLTNKLGNPDLSWLAQFGLGLAATFVHQLSVQFSGSKK